MRRKRVALLNAEADIQRVAVQDRAVSVQTKASFLVIAAGLFAGSSASTTLVLSPVLHQLWFLRYAPAIPILLALITVVYCARALWPTAQNFVSPQELKKRWIDAADSDYALEIYLLQTKVEAWNFVQSANSKRVEYIKVGFRFLVAAVAATVVVVVLRNIG